MGMYKVADGAFFVPSYSMQTITPAFDTSTTIQSLSGEPEREDTLESDARQPLYQNEDFEAVRRAAADGDGRAVAPCWISGCSLRRGLLVWSLIYIGRP